MPSTGALLAVGWSLLCLTSAQAATITAINCSQTEVQSAINTATDGDTVRVPAGRCTWTDTVHISGKWLILQGAGIGVTTIVQGTPLGVGKILEVEVPSGRFVQITGFTWDANNTGDGNSDHTLMVIGAGGLSTFRINQNWFENIKDRQIKIVSLGAPTAISGLIDHNTFRSGWGSDKAGTAQSIWVSVCPQPDNGFMDLPVTLGGPHAVFVEENVFSYRYAQDGGAEGYNCARVVFRFNTSHGMAQGHHGSEPRRGTKHFEYYNNTFDVVDMLPNSAGQLAPGRAHHIRSGTGFIFNETFTTHYGFINPYLYRVDQPYRNYGRCDGSSPWDGNEGSGTAYPARGYPCLDSPGWVFDTQAGNPGGVYTRMPMYVFNVRKGGALLGANSSHPTHIAENVEFFNETPSFNGTSGVGVGPLSARPVTCTNYTGYWATNEGEWNSRNGATPDGRFYQCQANSWRLYYTPYTFPHPLQSGPPTQSACDLNGNYAVTVHDVQLGVNQVLLVSPCTTGDINDDGDCTAQDVQRIVNAVLGGACVANYTAA